MKYLGTEYLNGKKSACCSADLCVISENDPGVKVAACVECGAIHTLKGDVFTFHASPPKQVANG